MQHKVTPWFPIDIQSSLAALSSPSLLWQPTVQYQTHCRCLCDLDWVGAC